MPISNKNNFKNSLTLPVSSEQGKSKTASRHTMQVVHRLDIGYVPPMDTSSLCLAVNSTRTVVPGLFRSLVRRSGTHCSQMNSEIRRVMLTSSNSSLKQCCSALTSATSTLEVINVMRSINSRFTYLLTYLVSCTVLWFSCRP